MSDVIPEAVPLHHATARAARAAPRPVVGVSLKLYFGLARTRAWLAEVAALDAALTGLPRPVGLLVLPSFPALADARELLSGTRIGYGAQDVHWAERGARTGEVPAGMLVETGARYVEVGHAERRRHFGETDETVAAKTRAATAAGLVPVVCAGEQRAGDPATAAEETLTQVRPAPGARSAPHLCPPPRPRPRCRRRRHRREGRDGRLPHRARLPGHRLERHPTRRPRGSRRSGSTTTRSGSWAAWRSCTASGARWSCWARASSTPRP
ncbi:triose-phosphate isomerase [Streptomyces sp. A1-5]|uniref:triose-phosphate isomerase n=1 Tax=Streptomyces sp. A1-5 TaxID=2738410 RepID=UPI001F3EBDED|nr:triose-phosphate isomerase family protein [Streptomyces sp. A1-5]